MFVCVVIDYGNENLVESNKVKVKIDDLCLEVWSVLAVSVLLREF